MGDGPDSSGQSRFVRPGDLRPQSPQAAPQEMPVYQETPTYGERFIRGPHGEYLGPNNPMDARHEVRYPTESPNGTIVGRDQQYLPVPALPYGTVYDPEKVVPPGPYRQFPLDQPVPTPTTARGLTPTKQEVHEAAGKFWNNTVDLGQVVWDVHKLYPHQQLPNWKNCPLTLAGGIFAGEVAIDAVTGLDKNEYQVGRIIADLMGPAMILNSSPLFNTWRKKVLWAVGTHTIGRVLDKLTEPMMKKLQAPPDA